MTISADTLRKLAVLNLAPEQMAGVLDILAGIQAADEERKAAQRERTRRHRASRDGNVTDTLQASYTPTPSPIKEKNQKKINPTPAPVCVSPARERAPREEFECEFWPAYPHKVGKPVAEASFIKARSKADLATVMAGLERYVQAKPVDRPWCNPSTWLNQERWADAPAPEPVVRLVHGKPHPPPSNDRPSVRSAMKDLLEGASDDRNPPPPHDDYGFDGPTLEGEFVAFGGRRRP